MVRIVNKVIDKSSSLPETLLDLTNDTVSENNLLQNETAHNSEGESVIGTLQEGGTEDYNDLNNKPQINNIILSGNKTSSQLGLVGLNEKGANNGVASLGDDGKVPSSQIPTADNVVLASAMTIGGQTVTEVESALHALKDAGGGGGTTNYNALENKPQINGNTLSGNQMGSQLGLQNTVLASSLTIGGQTINNVEGALSALNAVKQNVILASSLTIGGQIITEVEPALHALNNKPSGSGGHTIVDSDGRTYPARAKLKFINCDITDDSTNDTTIVKCEGGGGTTIVQKPTVTIGTYTYDGTQQAPTITGLDTENCNITGTYEATNAGSYTFTISLKNSSKMVWADLTNADLVYTWSIGKASLTAPTVTDTSKTFNGSAQSPTITRDTSKTTILGDYSVTNAGSYTFSIALNDKDNYLWADSSDTVDKSYNWSIIVPVGATVTPVNDVQIWQACAGIPQTHTTLAQVLADSTTLAALMLSHNAVDYLVRSTSWVSDITANQTAMTDIGADDYCANTLLADSTWRTAICNSTYFESVLNVKVPTMTSNTTPSGECFADSEWYNPAWAAFDGQRGVWVPQYSSSGDNNHYVGYVFTNTVSIYKCDATIGHNNNYATSGNISWQLQYSNSKNGSYTNISGASGSQSFGAWGYTSKTYIFNKISASCFRMYLSAGSGNYNRPTCGPLQFYGRASS